MSVATSTAKISYTLTTGSQALAVPFYFLENSHIKAIKAATSTDPKMDLVLGTDYTLSGAANPAGGTLTTIATVANGLVTGSKVVIKRNVPFDQLITYTFNDAFPSKTHEKGLDKNTMLDQQLKEQSDRAIQLPEDESGSVTLPSILDRANKTVGFDSTGLNVAMKTPISGDGVLETEAVGEDALQGAFRSRAQASVAAMKAQSYTNAKTGDRVELQGYNSRGDGGGGTLYVDKADTTTAANGGTVFVANDGTRIKRAVLGAIDTCWFGVVADWVSGSNGTDNFEAILAAIDLCQARKGGTVVFPEGDIYYAGSLNLTNFTWPITLMGKGKGTTLRVNVATVCIDCTGSSDVVLKDFQLAPTVTQPDVGILFARSATLESLRNMLINVSTAMGYNKAAVYNYCCEEFTVKDSYLINKSSGCAYWDTCDNAGTGEVMASPHVTIFSGSGSNTLKRMKDSAFQDDATTGTNDCVRLRGVQDSYFKGCFFIPAAAGTPSRSVVYLDNSSAITNSRIAFKDFRSEGGRKATNGFHINGSSSSSYIEICNGIMDLAAQTATAGHFMYATASAIAYLRFANVVGIGGVGIKLCNLEYSEIYSDISQLETTGFCSNNKLRILSTSSFADSVAGTRIFYTDTSQSVSYGVGDELNWMGTAGSVNRCVQIRNRVDSDANGTGRRQSLIFSTKHLGTALDTLTDDFAIDNSSTTPFLQSFNAFKFQTYTVATLPAFADVGTSAVAFVSDATLTAITGLGIAPTGGGANCVPVYTDNVGWKIL
jgi:hypothetical protein